MTLEELAEELRPNHNDICVLFDMELVRLVGVAQDDMDLYYIVRSTDPGKTQYWASAVGHIISLKGMYPEDRYEYMDQVFGLNRAERAEEFLVIDERKPQEDRKDAS